MLNLHAETMYELIYGDKDTYRLGFHLAGKASAFSQVSTTRSLHQITPISRAITAMLKLTSSKTQMLCLSVL